MADTSSSELLGQALEAATTREKLIDHLSETGNLTHPNSFLARRAAIDITLERFAHLACLPHRKVLVGDR